LIQSVTTDGRTVEIRGTFRGRTTVAHVGADGSFSRRWDSQGFDAYIVDDPDYARPGSHRHALTEALLCGMLPSAPRTLVADVINTPCGVVAVCADVDFGILPHRPVTIVTSRRGGCASTYFSDNTVEGILAEALLFLNPNTQRSPCPTKY
jgi:hypothetical protein